MKLKYIDINGYGILVDESAEIKDTDIAYNPFGDCCINISDIEDDMLYVNSEYSKVLFAESELNLDVPILPNWREWEKFELVDKHVSKLLLTSEGRTQRWWGFLEGLAYNKAKIYTEEDLRKAIGMAREESGLSDNTMSYDYDEDTIIQSLQKYPKYIVMESEYSDMHGMWFSEPTILKELDRPVRPKLTTNSQGKQEGIIKEIIWF